MNSRAASTATLSTGHDVWSVAWSLVQLCKPGITRMVLVTALCGALMAPATIQLGTLLWALLGTGLTVGAANALNMYLERDADALMARTKDRPLPSGRLSPEVALWFGVLTGLVGLDMLTFLVNPITGLLGAIALLSYVLVYTPLKRVTPLAVHVGALPGAMPPLMGWAAVTGELDALSLLPFAMLFVWQLPHFHAIAIFRKGEYERAGIRVLPAVRGVTRTKIEIVVGALLLAVVSVAPAFTGLAGLGYGIVVGLVSGAFVVYALRGFFSRDDDRWARRVFFASLPVLVINFTALVLSAA